MATLDRFLQVMFEKQGTAVVLESDKQVSLQVGTQRAALTKEAVPTPKLVALIKEIMPEGMRAQLDSGADGRIAFGYIVGDKRVDVELDRAHGAIAGTLAPAKPRRSTASVAVPAEHLLMEKPASEAPVRASTAQQRPDMEAVHKAEERLQELLRHLVTSGSSDLHLRVELPPCYRIHGELERLEGAAPLTREDIEGMILSIMPDRNKAEYAETNDTDYAYEMLGLARFRANAAKDRMGPVAVFRVIPAEIVPVEKLGITPEVQKLCYLTKGLVVVTGPTGSGKSTTLAGMVDLINRTRTDHIITVEDPIEFVHPNKKCVLTQRQVGTHTQSFKRALRAALRED
ncbi:MAG TPA: ATPase, T2SS/T4P/T4SS family, partial [Gemmatimonadales bacterium]